jgi:hypothetical protein
MGVISGSFGFSSTGGDQTAPTAGDPDDVGSFGKGFSRFRVSEWDRPE